MSALLPNSLSFFLLPHSQLPLIPVRKVLACTSGLPCELGDAVAEEYTLRLQVRQLLLLGRHAGCRRAFETLPELLQAQGKRRVGGNDAEDERQDEHKGRREAGRGSAVSDRSATGLLLLVCLRV